jgi:hypothetical protein
VRCYALPMQLAGVDANTVLLGIGAAESNKAGRDSAGNDRRADVTTLKSARYHPCGVSGSQKWVYSRNQP